MRGGRRRRRVNASLSAAPVSQPPPRAPRLAVGAPGVQGEANRSAARARGLGGPSGPGCRRRADSPRDSTLPRRRHRGM